MRERLFFLGSDYTQLHELVVDKTILPQCLGGAQADDAGGWVKQQVGVMPSPPPLSLPHPVTAATLSIVQVEAMLAEHAAAEEGAPAGAK